MEEPVTKKQKVIEEEEGEEEDNYDDHDESTSVILHKNDQGEAFIDLSSKKRLTIRKFKGNTLIDIREVRSRCFFYHNPGFRTRKFIRFWPSSFVLSPSLAHP